MIGGETSTWRHYYNLTASFCGYLGTASSENNVASFNNCHFCVHCLFAFSSFAMRCILKRVDCCFDGEKSAIRSATIEITISLSIFNMIYHCFSSRFVWFRDPAVVNLVAFAGISRSLFVRICRLVICFSTLYRESLKA